MATVMMIDRSSDPLDRVRQEMAAVGINPAAAFRALPDWASEAAEHPTGIIEIKAFIARHFGLEFAADGTLRPRILAPCCFKTTKGTNTADLAPAQAFATSVAHLLAAAITVPWSGRLPLAGDLREDILNRPDVKWVGLPELLAACWEAGIPVVYLPELPVNGPKMDGMVTVCNGRPVIIITKRPDKAAWVLFVLAHEIGHIGQGHLDGADSIVDEVVSEEAAGDDRQEKEANTYALELLTGVADQRFTGPIVKAEQLASMAREIGAARRIDPGHLLLNCAKTMQGKGKQSYFPVANAALKFLPSGNPASDACKAALRRNINTHVLPDDSVQFLENIGLL